MENNTKYRCSGKTYNGEKAIISLTSWKARINTVSKTLFSILKQCPGFHVVLVLSEEEFPQHEKELPESLMVFIQHKLIELLWVHKNYKAFKKVVFTMDKYRTVPVISADDDCIYTCNYAQILYDEWEKHPDCIITNDGMPIETHGIKWGRGPNTLYPIKFSYLCIKLNVIKSLETMDVYEEDDSFYGTICKKFKIQYIDLNRSEFYIFHDTISPLHETIKSMRRNLLYYDDLI